VTLAASRFNVAAETFDGHHMLLFNTFTGALQVCGEDGEAAIRATVAGRRAPESWMVEGGFVVEDGFDERAALRRRYAIKETQTSGLSLTIATSTDCNLACVYCFQDHPKRRLDEADIKGIVAFVAARLRPDEPLQVTWYGGEPLLNMAAIRRLNGAFAKIAGRYRQAIITNGVLLKAAQVEYFAEQGNVDYVQITLDGPKDAHDQRRPMARGASSFELIVDHVARAAAKLPITLRMNVDRRNAAQIDALVDLLDRRGVLRNVSLYLGHVRAFTELCGDTQSHVLSKEEFADLEIHLMWTLWKRGIRNLASLPRPRFGSNCIADNPKGAVIAPRGVLFDCWNEAASPPSAANGDLSSGKSRQTQYDPFAFRDCADCAIQPLCLAGCSWEARKAGAGDCTTLRYNLQDRLRVHHLDRVLNEAMSPRTDEVGRVPPDATPC